MNNADALQAAVGALSLTLGDAPEVATSALALIGALLPAARDQILAEKVVKFIP